MKASCTFKINLWLFQTWLQSVYFQRWWGQSKAFDDQKCLHRRFIKFRLSNPINIWYGSYQAGMKSILSSAEGPDWYCNQQEMGLNWLFVQKTFKIPESKAKVIMLVERAYVMKPWAKIQKLNVSIFAQIFKLKKDLKVELRVEICVKKKY